MSRLTVLSLFTGIGGIDLAFQRAGFEVIGQIENDEFCNRVLAKHWPRVPRWGDIRDVTGGHIRAKTGTRTIDVMAGGFPCQDISVAGRGDGIQHGNRSGLWFEFARLIGDLRPRVIFLENVPAITTRGGTLVIADLAALGYDAQWGMFRASDVGAPHQRERWFCVAYATRPRCHTSSATGRRSNIRHKKRHGSANLPARRQLAKRRTGSSGSNELVNTAGPRLSHRRPARKPARNTQSPAGMVTESKRSSSVGHATRHRLQGRGAAGQQVPRLQTRSTISRRNGAGSGGRNGQAQSVMGRAIDGFSNRLDGYQWPARPDEPQHAWEPPRVSLEKIPNRPARIKALGNAVVPQVIEPFAQAIRQHLQKTEIT